MHGNVAEWCEDLYRPYPGNKGASGSRDHVCRGGSWADIPAACRSAKRDEFPDDIGRVRPRLDRRGIAPPDTVDLSYIGFRVVVTAE